MKKSPWFKVRVINCCNPDYWYADKIGDVIIVKKTEWDGWGFEHKNGSSVFRHDVEAIANAS